MGGGVGEKQPVGDALVVAKKITITRNRSLNGNPKHIERIYDINVSLFVSKRVIKQIYF